MTVKFDRRETLYWMGFVSALIVSGVSPATAGVPSVTRRAQGYGKDPNLLAPERSWPLTLTVPQKQRLAALADGILPGTTALAPPSALGIAAFLDEWLSAPYPHQEADRALILPLTDIPGQPITLLARMQVATDPLLPALARLRLLVVTACYTTPDGMKAIGYIGNEPRESFDGPPLNVLAAFDAEAAKLSQNSGPK